MVEQVFTRAVNLFLPQRNALYTLLSAACDNAPNSCRLALEHCNTLFRPGERVTFSTRGIAVGRDKYVDFANCRPWQPEAIIFNGTRRWQRVAGIIKENIKDHASLFYYQGENIFYREISRLLHLHRQALLNALKHEDYSTLENAAVNLMGLGIGLTPSGDDYLTGLSVILFMPGSPACKYREALLAAQENGKEKTTLLSAITLREAIFQRYREVIHRFIYQLNVGGGENIHQTINEIKQIGSSSGSDMLYGMADALALTAYLGGNDVDQDCD